MEHVIDLVGRAGEQGFDRAVEQSLDAIRAKINWLKRDRDDVEQWLGSNSYLQSKL